MTAPLFDLSHRTALVTGGGRGLGRAIALALAGAGARVAVVGRSAAAEHTAAEIAATGQASLALRADLADPASRAGLIDRVAAALGPVDILVHNAGNQHRQPAESFDPAAWQSLMAVHVEAGFDLARQAAPAMFAAGAGKVIVIGSVLSFQGGWTVTAYTAAKHALLGLVRALANEWASRGINVNGIAPGYIETDMSLPLKHDPLRGPQIMARIPAGRWGRPDDLAGAAVFLASPAADYVHGHMLVVDGGWLSR